MMAKSFRRRVPRGPGAVSSRLFLLVALCSPWLSAPPAHAQHAGRDSLALSLDQAVARALREGEEMKIAEVQLDLADAQVTDALSDFLPQLTFNLGYTRQISSIFSGSGLGGGGGAASQLPVFSPDPSAPLDQRVSALEDALPTAGVASLLGQFSSGSPFGRSNTWNAGFTVNQVLFEGSKLWNAPRAAVEVREATDAQFRERRKEITGQVKKAYYDALLAERAVEIARSSLDQAERQLAQVRLRHREGNLADFDLLQAEVQRDNQIPEVMDAEDGYDAALLELKRLVNVPVDTPVRLTSGMMRDGSRPIVVPPLALLLKRSRSRPSIESALHETQARAQNVNIARSDFLPKLSVFSTYNRQAFPTGLFPGAGDWRTDWSVGFTMSMNVFDGLRTRANIDEARANLKLARQQHAQVEETVAIEVRQAYRNLQRTYAQITARRRTVEQAERAARLAEIRHDEGISTQLEVLDARLQLQRARMNHAQAIHDYHVAVIDLERAANVNLPAK